MNNNNTVGSGRGYIIATKYMNSDNVQKYINVNFVEGVEAGGVVGKIGNKGTTNNAVGCNYYNNANKNKSINSSVHTLNNNEIVDYENLPPSNYNSKNPSNNNYCNSNAAYVRKNVMAQPQQNSVSTVVYHPNSVGAVNRQGVTSGGRPVGGVVENGGVSVAGQHVSSNVYLDGGRKGVMVVSKDGGMMSVTHVSKGAGGRGVCGATNAGNVLVAAHLVPPPPPPSCSSSSTTCSSIAASPQPTVCEEAAGAIINNSSNSNNRHNNCNNNNKACGNKVKHNSSFSSNNSFSSCANNSSTLNHTTHNADNDTVKPMSSIPRLHVDWNIPPRYEIKHLIGTGSYGHVCEAYDRLGKRVVAIKKIHRVFEDLIDCKRILREIAILNRLNHLHVVEILDIVVPKDIYKFDELYVVLEIADSDFKKLFRTPVYLTELHVKTLLYNLLVGVKYIHSCGIFHRDLKPANCLVNQDCSVKICDFGLARTVEKPSEQISGKVSYSPREYEQEVGDTSKNLKRQLTGHVVTRWYRAPELILLQEMYTEAIDVWSAGCIFAELLNMMKENVASYNERGPLFPGSSCFPLSPDQKHSTDYKFHTRGNRDQLNMIFNVLGTPSDEDIESLEKEDAKRYIRIFTKRQGNDLQERFPAASPEAIDLLKRMLVFNPNKRITVEEALCHPLFFETRNRSIETVATERACLPFDDWQNMNEPQLRYGFLKEIQRFHPELTIPDNFPFTNS